MTLDDLWKLTRRYWVLLVVSLFVGTVLAGAYVATRTPVYSATTRAYIVPIGENGSDGQSTGSAYSGSLLAQQKAKGWEPLFTSSGAAEATINALKLDTTPEALAARLSTELVEETPSISVTATAGSPREAQRVADGIVVAASAEAKKLEGDAAGVEIKPIENAQLPTRPSSPRPERALPLGALVGLMVGYLVAIVRLRQDTRVRNQGDVEKATGASVLAVMPESKDLESADRQVRGSSNFATRESLRELRTNLRYVDIDHSPRTIVVTSARMAEGKSTIAANLARVLSESGQPVILVDSDLRRPAVAGIFGLDPSVGLTQVLAGTVSIEDALQDSGQPNLRILAAGQIPPNPSELLGSERMHQLLLSLRSDQMVVLDAPPLLPVTDAALLTARADGALLVVSASDTREEHLTRAVTNIHRVGGRILGAVLNRVNTKRLKRIVYGEGQYGYGQYGGYGEYVQDPGTPVVSDAVIASAPTKLSDSASQFTAANQQAASSDRRSGSAVDGSKGRVKGERSRWRRASQ